MAGSSASCRSSELLKKFPRGFFEGAVFLVWIKVEVGVGADF